MELIDIKGIGEATLNKLTELNIKSVKDLILFLPSAYIDLSDYSDMSKAENGNFYLFKGKVKRLYSLKRGLRRNSFFKAEIISGNTILTLNWFNQPYLYDKIKGDEEYTFFGKISKTDKDIEISNPVFESFGKEIKLKGILPIYKTEGLIHQANIRTFIKQALEKNFLVSLIDPNLAEDINSTLRKAHNPKTVSEGYDSQKRVALEDIVNTIINYRIVKRKSIKDKNRTYNNISITEIENLLNYELTLSQKLAIREIIGDMQNLTPMNRMLLGDVGSGKTIVSMIAAYVAIKNGYQAVLMAPTTILANQHYKSAEVLNKLNIRVRLLTGEIKAAERIAIIDEINSGNVDLLIGTHSLLNDGIHFPDLGLIITDELHRFGVSQKNDIEMKGRGVDTLVMSATPIPRALALSLYEDLAVSKIDRRADLKIKTSIVPPHKFNDMVGFLLSEIKNGRQAYIVCPRIEDIEGIELSSVKSLYNELRKGLLKDINLGLLFGSQSNEVKNQLMKKFSEGKINVLISTTVIEVGIDVPNASVMIIMNAERYGLAALHQLRGRVGRGEYKSYCLLYSSSEHSERLNALKTCNDGMEIAEIDYELRGGGDFIGLRQSGISKNKYIINITNGMIIEAKKLAENIIIDEKNIEKFEAIRNNETEMLVRKVTMN